MNIAEIKEKLEMAYNEEDWNVIADLIESLSYHVELNEYGDDDWANPDGDFEG